QDTVADICQHIVGAGGSINDYRILTISKRPEVPTHLVQHLHTLLPLPCEKCGARRIEDEDQVRSWRTGMHGGPPEPPEYRTALATLLEFITIEQHHATAPAMHGRNAMPVALLQDQANQARALQGSAKYPRSRRQDSRVRLLIHLASTSVSPVDMFLPR